MEKKMFFFAFIPLFMILFGCEKEDNTEKETTKKTTMLDGSGISYPTVTIGSQVWTSVNLMTTKYKNGDPIPNITDATEWANSTTGAYRAFVWNGTDMSSYFGYLYNWYAINDSRGLAQDGWHIPTLSDWNSLVGNLGGSSVAGTKLKQPGNDYWWAWVPSEGASGFNARGGGYCEYTGGCINESGFSAGYWWTSSEIDQDNAYGVKIANINSMVDIGSNHKKRGFSIRCIKNP